MYFAVVSPVVGELNDDGYEFGLIRKNNRELKQRQPRRQRERHEFAYLVVKNNSFARPARAFFIFVHFVAVVSKTTT